MATKAGDEKLLKDYHELSEDYQRKVEKYIAELRRLQRMENKVSADIRHHEWQRRRETGEPGIRCSFCGKHQEEAEKIIAAPNQVYICDECARLCNDILDEYADTDDGKGETSGT